MTDFDAFISLNDAERLAHETGQYRGATVEFSNDGETWTDAWVPSDAHDVPVLARATVLRKHEGDATATPYRATVRWAEYVPDEDDDRRENWMRMSTTMLAKVARVSALRGGFRDVIGERYEPAELDQARGKRSGGARPAPTVDPTVVAEWEALIATAETPDEIRELDKSMRAAKQMTEGLNVTLTKRLATIEKRKPRARA